MNNKGFEFSFAWIFAIIVGAVVIFLAIYTTTSLIGNSRYESDTKIAAQLQSILSPIETNLEEGKSIVLGFSDETRIYNECRNFGTFGEQKLSTATKSGIGKEWMEPGVAAKSSNKYIFSSKILQGKEIYVFVKPLKMPYKVADMMFMYTGKYCFVNPPNDIEEEINDLQLPGITINNSENCPLGSRKVCFSSSGCDIDVRFNVEDDSSGSVVKKEGTVRYESGLIYGAIFSDFDVYGCQVERLMKRNSELAQLYAAKTNFLSGEGCSSNLAGDLISYSDSLKEADSGKLSFIKLLSDGLKEKNDRLNCKLF
ncbi:hypothetical protein AUJ84_00235 [Candidatus Pacearchaeota archaeon CG1_02_32_132]|nr:MAG: hypothetical protein AUJ84_00235 [Candidatus Pacearchaeota archaeon CG1_02_32_132]